MAAEAKNIAVGRLVRERIDENIKTLKNIEQERKYSGIVDRINTVLQNVVNRSKTKETIQYLKDNVFSHARELAGTAGRNSEIYKKWCGYICNVSLNSIQEMLAAKLVSLQESPSASAFLEIPTYFSLSLSVIDELNHLSLDSEHQANVNEISGSLKELKQKFSFLDRSPSRSSPDLLGEDEVPVLLDRSPSRSSPDGSTSRPTGYGRGYESTSRSSGGCYIATMVYGDYDHPQVMVLRDFRDSVLMKHFLGRKFVKLYYAYSPRLVEHLKDCTRINTVIRHILDCFVRVYRHAKK